MALILSSEDGLNRISPDIDFHVENALPVHSGLPQIQAGYSEKQVSPGHY